MELVDPGEGVHNGEAPRLRLMHSLCLSTATESNYSLSASPDVFFLLSIGSQAVVVEFLDGCVFLRPGDCII